MKYLLYIFYFFRSVFLRGFFNTFKLLRAEARFEKLFHIKTAAIKKSDSLDYFHYQGASYLVLLRIFKEVSPQTKDFDFVDIGSGKGRAVFVAENCGYNTLYGIELDCTLLKDAVENLKHYAFKRKESDILFVHQNAIEYSYTNRPSVYFLFNPFNEQVMEKVLQKISSCTDKESWFIYMNPQYTKPFTDKKMELIKEFKTGRYLEAVVFKMN